MATHHKSNNKSRIDNKVKKATAKKQMLYQRSIISKADYSKKKNQEQCKRVQNMDRNKIKETRWRGQVEGQRLAQCLIAFWKLFPDNIC